MTVKKTSSEFAKELLDAITNSAPTPEEEALARKVVDAVEASGGAGHYAMIVNFTPADMQVAYNRTRAHAAANEDEVNKLANALSDLVAGHAHGNVLMAMAYMMAASLDTEDQIPMVAALAQRFMVDGFRSIKEMTRPPGSRLN